VSAFPHVTKLSVFGAYKYRIDDDYEYRTQLLGFDIDLPFVALGPLGILTLKKGYCWNGASGPTWDTPSCRRGSALHDAGYQLLGAKLLPMNTKGHIDKAWLHDICIEDGMSAFRAGYWLWGVQTFGGGVINRKVPKEEEPDHG